MISAYVALATVAAGLLAYGTLRPGQKEPVVGELTIEPVKQEQPDRIVSRSVPADRQTAIQ